MAKEPTMKQLRLVRNWTQAQLAEKAGCSVATLIRAEAEKRWPSNASVRKAVQAALGVQPTKGVQS